MGLIADLLCDHFNNLTGWTDGDTDTGVSEIDPAGQLRLDTNSGAAGNAIAGRFRVISSPPNQFTIEVKTYFDSIGALGDTDYCTLFYSTATWLFYVIFASDGLYILKTGAGLTEVGTNIVKTGGSAAEQTWRFEVDKSGGEGAATVEVFLDDISQGTFDCDWEEASTDGLVLLYQYGYTNDDMVSHIEYLRIATGNDEIASIGKVNGTTIASLGKFSGIDKATINKVNGIPIN